MFYSFLSFFSYLSAFSRFPVPLSFLTPFFPFAFLTLLPFFSSLALPLFSTPYFQFSLRPPFCCCFLFLIFRFWFLDRVEIFFSLLLSCYKSSTKKLARSRFLGFQEKVKVATLYYIVLQFYLFFLKAKKLLAKGKSTLPSPSGLRGVGLQGTVILNGVKNPVG